MDQRCQVLTALLPRMRSESLWYSFSHQLSSVTIFSDITIILISNNLYVYLLKLLQMNGRPCVSITAELLRKHLLKVDPFISLNSPQNVDTLPHQVLRHSVRGCWVFEKACGCRAACRRSKTAQSPPAPLWPPRHWRGARCQSRYCGTAPCSGPCSSYLCGSGKGKQKTVVIISSH